MSTTDEQIKVLEGFILISDEPFVDVLKDIIDELKMRNRGAKGELIATNEAELVTNYKGEKFVSETQEGESQLKEAIEIIESAERRMMGERKLLQDLGKIKKGPMILGMDTDLMTITEITENIRMIEEDIETLIQMFAVGKMSAATKKDLEGNLHFKNYDIDLLRESLQKFNDLMPF